MCLNRNCKSTFNSSAETPTCPTCGGRRHHWLPQPVAINGGKARTAEADVKSLADSFNMTNVAAPERGMPAIRPNPGVELRSFRPNAAPGWVGQYAVNAEGKVGAACVPTGITARMPAKNIIDRPLRSNSYDMKQEVGAGSDFQGRWGDSNMIKAAMDKLK